MTWTPPPGTIGLTYSYGFTGFRAALGQALTNETTTYNHAFIVVSDRDIIEPWPSGARATDIGDYEDEDVAYGYIPDLTERQQMALASAALSLDGIGHGLLDYAALAAFRYGWHPRWVRRRAADTARLLPAQFVAEAYRRAGVNLFPEARNVTMEDLGGLLLTSNHWDLRVPCLDFGVPRGRYAR